MCQKNKLVLTAILFVLINVHEINTQTAASQIVEATTVDENYERNTDIRRSRNRNSSAEFVESGESNVQFLDELKPQETIESASRVVVATQPNSTANELKFSSVQKNNSSPVKHPVRELNVDEAKSVLSRNTNNAKIRAHVRYDEVTGELLDGDHPCHRECKEGEEPMICYYHFVLEWYQTMSKACYNCPYNETDCSRPDCIAADGMNRALNVVNRKMPGPAVEVCQHDRVIVDVENDLMTEGTTVHWHGQHQRGTPYMDGTPYVTQCPIVPETTFRYQFNASHAGTHFWHSHSGMQRADGAAGAFIIRKPKSQDHHGNMYDYDRSEHVMIVTDWIHDLAIGMFTDHHHSTGDNKPPTLLINGVGRFKVFNNDTAKPVYMKAARFNVEQGYKYRFRVINAEFLNCPIELSVDGHNITVIASDGYDLQPITATSLVTYAGERYDFILEANNEIDNYWIRFRGLMDCDEVFTKAKQVGVLHYEGAMDLEPPGDPTWFELHNEGLIPTLECRTHPIQRGYTLHAPDAVVNIYFGASSGALCSVVCFVYIYSILLSKQLNALNKGEEEDETVSVAEMRSVAGYDDSLKEVADYQFYVAYDFYAKNNSHFHRSPYYGYYQVPKKQNRLYTPQLNHISMKLPSSPLMLARPTLDNFCNASSIDESCLDGYCECSHVLAVKLNSVVEIVIVDEGVTFDANHPFHLHGHSFRVVGLRRLAKEITVDEIKAYDKAGLLKRNLKNAPIKDTVTVPDGGYTVIRFKADNPGYWLFHCHIEFHVEIGMALVFKVGEHKDMAPVPKDFPTCGSYLPDNMLELATTEKPKDNDVISISHWWPVVVINNNSTSSSTIIYASETTVLLSLWLLLQNFIS